MIQRIQSLYLLLLAVLGIIFFFGGEYLTLTISNVITVLIPILSLIIIFLFSKIKMQLKLTKILIALIIILICVTGSHAFNILSDYHASFGSRIKAVIPLIQLLLAVFAYLSIKRDNDLMKSYNRLR
jgi:hypothetical protein